jgi:hypothetical protein
MLQCCRPAPWPASSLPAETQVIIGDAPTHFTWLTLQPIPTSTTFRLFFHFPPSHHTLSALRAPTDLSPVPVALTHLRAKFPAAAAYTTSNSTSCTISPGVAGFDLPKPLHLCARARRSDLLVKHSRATSRMLQSTLLLFRIPDITHACRTRIP